MNNIINLIKKNREIISYLFWGVATTCVSWGSYSLFVKGYSLGVALSNSLSWVCAVLFAFITNKIFVFRSRSWKSNIILKEFGLFVSSRLVTGLFEIILVPLLVQMGLNQGVLGVEGAVSKITVSIFVVIMNYFLSKFLIFK